MKGETQLPKPRWTDARSRRKWILVGVAAVLFAALWIGSRQFSTSQAPWLVRWKLDRYLAKRAHTSDFKAEFAFPTTAEMKQAAGAEEETEKGKRTGKDFATLRAEYLTNKTAALALEREVTESEVELRQIEAQLRTATNATTATGTTANVAALQERAAQLQQTTSRRTEWQSKEQELLPITADLWDFQRSWSGDAAGTPLAQARGEFITRADGRLREAASYEEMYRIIGQELFVAKRLLQSRNREHRREGLRVAMSAARHAIAHPVNGYVAARIADGFLLPNLELATDRNARSMFHPDTFLAQCADLFRRNEEHHNAARVYRIQLARAQNSAGRDRARAQIADALHEGGEIREAIATLREIENTNSYARLLRQIPRWELDAKVQQ
jgi:hypothetical protein